MIEIGPPVGGLGLLQETVPIETKGPCNDIGNETDDGPYFRNGALFQSLLQSIPHLNADEPNGNLVVLDEENPNMAIVCERILSIRVPDSEPTYL